MGITGDSKWLFLIVAIAYVSLAQPALSEVGASEDLTALREQLHDIAIPKGTIALSVTHEIRNINPHEYPAVRGVEVNSGGGADYWVAKEITIYLDYPRYYYEQTRLDREGRLLDITREAYNGVLSSLWMEEFGMDSPPRPAYQTRTDRLAEEKADTFWKSLYPNLVRPDLLSEHDGSMMRQVGNSIVLVDGSDRFSSRTIELDSKSRRLRRIQSFREDNLYEEFRYHYSDDKSLIPAKIIWYEGFDPRTDEPVMIQEIMVQKFSHLVEMSPEERARYGNFVVKPDFSKEFRHSDINQGIGRIVSPRE